jgi:hypothetical protein
MEATNQSRGTDQCILAESPWRKRRHGDIAIDPFIDISALVVSTQDHRGAAKTACDKVFEEPVDRGRMCASGTAHRITDAHHMTLVYQPAREVLRDLLHCADRTKRPSGCRLSSLGPVGSNQDP